MYVVGYVIIIIGVVIFYWKEPYDPRDQKHSLLVDEEASLPLI